MRDIFFSIREVDVPESQQEKVRQIAAYLNENPNAKVTVSGYADAGTGSKSINAKYAKQRAESVAKEPDRQVWHQRKPHHHQELR